MDNSDAARATRQCNHRKRHAHSLSRRGDSRVHLNNQIKISYFNFFPNVENILEKINIKNILNFTEIHELREELNRISLKLEKILNIF